jgi:KUP system potassium uptake protein
MAIFHTSGGEMGQVYLPTVNWLLMVAVFVLVLSFQSSSALASAYGIAVTGTMLTTTLLAFIVIKALWRWNKYTSTVFLLVFLTLDFIYLSANAPKIVSGGWLPLVVGAVLYLIMTTWIKGRALLVAHHDKKRVLFEELETEIQGKSPIVVPGTAIYMTRSLHGLPPVFLHNYEHNHVLHEQIVVLSIVTKDEPYVDEAHRVKIRSYGTNHQFYRVKLYFGFKQPQDVRRALELCVQQGLDTNPKKVSFFVGREFISFRRNSPMPAWRRPLSSFLFHNSASAIEFFKIPVDRVIEIGNRVEL